MLQSFVTHILSTIWLLSKSTDSQNFSCFEEWCEITLMYIHLPVVDKLHKRIQVSKCNILKNYDRVFAWCTLSKEGNKFKIKINEQIVLLIQNKKPNLATFNSSLK